MKDTAIFINQIGYLPSDSKFAYFTQKSKGDSNIFELCQASDGSVVYSGNLSAACQGQIDPAAGEPVFYADFSDFNKNGEYFVRANGQNSFPFKISEHVYDDVYFSTLNYFKLSRCGQGLCHTGVAEVYGTGEKLNVQGGWHDAGDYGRYIVAGAKSVMDLLFAYDSTGSTFKNFDILDEVRFELEWMLQLQREDGAVYHKISCYHFCGFIMPEEETDQLVIAPVSTAATADFAGCLAYAAAYFEASDKAFAQRLVDAAKKAQNYLESHQDQLFINPPEITTGGYGDRNVDDERYFAACGLWAATKNPEYLEKAKAIRSKAMKRNPDPNCPWDRGWIEAFGWCMFSGYGTEILLKNADLIEDKAFVKDLQSGVLKMAEEYLETAKKSAFRTCSKMFFWGSNGALCDTAHVMLLAYSFTNRQEFKTAGKAQIDYISGCNPMDICYITGAGSKSPKHPHHRPSGASKNVMPGMVVGGPSSGLQDEYAKKHLTGMPPLKCYIDAQPSYSTNEVAIYWNSAFVYLLSKMI